MKLFGKSVTMRLRLLPVLIIVAMLAFAVRVGDAVVTLNNMSGQAFAEDKKAEEPTKAPDSSAAALGTQPSTEHLKTPEESVAGDVKLPSTDAPPAEAAKEWEDAKDIDTEYSELKQEMYKELIDRRRALDDREKAIGEREALLEAGQRELDRKYKEMTGLRDEIQSLLKNQSEAESSRMASLVKIYTGMKPKDAARIFNTLDMDILVEVIGKMPESKSAPILASMDADRARALTTLLAEQKKLPDIPQ
ncbi:MAG: flagellar protein FlbB [Alphaproteobacteria bacterium]|nr:flagellar protein FlbB [Alphaproteobacteria bacterium]MCB9984399.1 flagellar protein FlbB [Micavibrio sp.]HPQ50834.1 flagellar protein FlbB [Alphaproteobacteria bacterium]HRK97835.1 flagellar protein FlbB [Alphaproteobacteria bacterium]